MTKAVEIENLIESITIKENYELVDVQYVKENGDWIVRIFIDKDGGVTMSDCEKISLLFGAVLDERDILKDSYVLEVSSPGLNRVLKKEESFKRFIGAKIRLQTFEAINNQKNFLGKLLDFKDGIVKIEDAANGIVEIKFLDIKKANVETEF
ncbi:MAG: ribosome maturation factor RimP [Endomicrobium sp.]|jgi:ribosome maturation factor RimP|nr:ribosome maturation factor RimP [Endomicrobium sp.]MDR2399953.1 ribosome maturation factor RimP [Endomicrobium sp.]